MNDSRKQDVLELDFVIVGGGQPFWTVGARVHVLTACSGLAGLATAHALASSKHRVRVFDASSGTSNSAASGFRVTPNGCKVLEQWGVWEEFTVRACKVASTEFIDRMSSWLSIFQSNYPNLLYVYFLIKSRQERESDTWGGPKKCCGSWVAAGTLFPCVFN